MGEIMIKKMKDSQFELLISDACGAISGWKFWLYLAWMDVKGQYRRSFVGPVWLTLNAAIFISAFSFLGARIFKSPIGDYIIPFACGQILFVFLSTTLNESAYAFINSAAYVKQLPVPRLSFVLRVVAKNAIIFMHTLPVLLGIIILWGSVYQILFFNLLLGVIGVFVLLSIFCAVVSLVAARFRDVPMIVSNVVNLCYFATPIIWPAEMLKGGERFLLYLNPFYLMIDVIRSPLLGRPAGEDVWFCFLMILLTILVVGIPLAVKYRRSIPYWV